MFKPMPKSLHTVSVLVNVARLFQQLAAANGGARMSAEYAVESAIGSLGYHGAPDPCGLAQRSVAVLSKGEQS